MPIPLGPLVGIAGAAGLGANPFVQSIVRRPTLAWDNARTRWQNMAEMGGSLPQRAEAFLTPNRFADGDLFYHTRPTNVAGVNNFTPQPTSDTDGGGGDVVGGGVAPQWVTMAGQTYNLSDPNDRIRYFSDRMRILETQRDQYILDLETQIGRSITDAELQRDSGLASISQDIADTEMAAANFVRDYTAQVNRFGDEKAVGDVRRQQAFSALSPNAFQSAQASSQGFANQQFLQGLGEMAAGAAENVGADFLADPTDFNRLGTDTVLGRQRANLFADRENVGTQYNRFVQDRQEQLLRGRQEAQDRVTQGAEDLTGTFAPINMAQGLDPFRYNRFAFNPATLGQADLSRFTPFTNFQGTAPREVQGGTGFVPRTGRNLFTDTTPLENFLGQNRLTDTDRDFLRNYLLGRG